MVSTFGRGAGGGGGATTTAGAGPLLRFDAAGLATGAVDGFPISPAIRMPPVSVGITSSGLRSTSVIDPFGLRERNALRLVWRDQQA